MKDIQVSATPASITANFDEVRESLRQELERYDVVVTEDTLKESKAMATELNKAASRVDEVRKAKVAEVSEPIETFKAQMNELRDMLKDGRQRIKSQVDKFEDRKRAEAADLAEKYANELRLHHGIDEAFYTDVGGNMSWVTAKGNLTKAGKEAVAAHVEREVAQATEIGRRRHNVRTMIGDMVGAVDLSADDFMEQAERIAATQAKQEPAAFDSVEPAPKPASGKVRVTCVFEIETTAPEETIKSKVRSRIEEAGIKGLTEILIERQ